MLDYIPILISLSFLLLSIQLLYFLIQEKDYPVRLVQTQYMIQFILLLLLFTAIAVIHRRFPVGNFYEALYFAALIITIATAILEYTLQDRSFSFLVMPVSTVLTIIAGAGFNPMEALPPYLWSTYWPLHVAFSLSSFVFLFIASLFAGAYLLKFQALKKMNLVPGLVKRIPPLDRTDRFQNYFVLMGIAALSVGLLMGFLWIWDLHQQQEVFKMSRNLSRKIIFTLLVWFIFSGATLLRLLGILQNRRYAYVVLAGFSIMLASLSIGNHAF